MTAVLAQSVLLLLALAVQHLWLRPRVARRLLHPVAAFVGRRAHNARYTLAAARRGLALRPHQPRHIPGDTR